MESTTTEDQYSENLRKLRNANAAAIEAFSPKIIVTADRAPKNRPAHRFPKFMQLPAELRIYVWEQAFLNESFRFHAPFPRGSIQRFRFDLKWDPDRVKPGRDESRGWVACFTPLSINTRPYLKFLRVCYESREHMMHVGDMSMLTVHEMRHNRRGIPVGRPSKCHVPYHFGRDVFCVEGISHGVDKGLIFEEEAWNRAKDKECVVGPRTLSERLENALGLRFAPRIKRLAIIPQYQDLTEWEQPENRRLRPNPFNFIRYDRGGDMATLAQRFPSLVSVRSAIPQAGYCKWEKPGLKSSPGYFQWYGADLRARGLGGPTGMSKGVRDALYRKAWMKLFGFPFDTCRSRIKPELWKGCVCLVRRSKGQLSMVDEFGPPFPEQTVRRLG